MCIRDRFIYSYEKPECDVGVNPVLASVVLGGLAVATFIIFQFLTMNGRRRRKKRELMAPEEEEEEENSLTNLFQDVVWAGGYLNL